MVKILHIGFGYAPFWHGGMVIYQIDLMKELQNLGYDIGFFAAGRYDFRRRPYLARTKINDIKTIEMVNSPNLYDPYCYRSNPQDHCRNSVIEDIVKEIIKTEQPRLVHLHDLRMQSASIIEVIKKFGLPIIKTIHNYWDLCPKDDMLYDNSESCNNFNNGEKCPHCLENYCESEMSHITRLKVTMQSKFLTSTIGALLHLKKTLIPHRTKKKIIPLGFSPESYKERREYFIKMLNLCDIVHTTSNYCSEKLKRYGIKREVIRVIPLSVRLLSQIKPKPLFQIHYPINFGYRGAIHMKKGIHILLRAYSQLAQDKCKLIIYGDGDNNLLKEYSTGNLNIEFRGHHTSAQIQKSVKDIDVGVVPSIWEEPFGIVGLEYLNARIPVIGSKIGGIAEWLKDGENGFLFTPSDVDQLAAIMRKFIDDPELIRKIQVKMKPWKTIGVHAKEISDLYNLLFTKMKNNSAIS